MATEDTIRSYYANILQRSGSEVTDAEIAFYASAVDNGRLSLEQVRSTFIQSPEGQDVQDVVRLYQAVFGRVPDKDGLNSQVDALRGIATEGDLANSFAASPEFITRFGTGGVDINFVDSVYQQVLGRSATFGELDFYLTSGFSAARIVLAFSESPEFKASTQDAVASFLDAAGQGTAIYAGPLGGSGAPIPDPTTEPTPPPPPISVYSIADAAAVTEGGSLVFTVSRTGEISQAGTVTYTLGGTATPGPGGDYTAPDPLSVSFAAGSTTASIVIPTIDDAVVDGTETVTVLLNAVTGGSGRVSTVAGENGGTGLILDNDRSYAIAVLPASGSEDDGHTFTYTVTRAGVLDVATIDVALSGTASANDYALSGLTGNQLSFAANEIAKSFTVTSTLDLVDEADETVIATISNASDGGAIAISSATATILDDDPTPSFSTTFDVADEGQPLEFVVSLSGPSDTTQTVVVSTSDGTAIAGSDYTAKSQTLTFAPGVTSQTFSVDTIDDDVLEGYLAETVIVELSNASPGATIATSSTVGFISNNDF